MPSLNFVWLDVFTTQRYSGNPLAVVRIPPDRHNDLSTEQMQTIAFEFNLSETVFIYERSPSTSASDEKIPEWNFRIFFPTAELPFAGHPTIGTAVYASSTLAVNPPTAKSRLICKAGPIDVDYREGVAKASIPHNFHRHSEVPFTLEQVYELQPSLKDIGLESRNIDTISPVKGMNFVSIELPSLDALEKLSTSAISPKPTLDADWNQGFAGSYWYIVMSRSEGKVQIRSRMIEGALEDPATGSAACALSCFLSLKWRKSKVTKYEITQGVEMKRRSDIKVVVSLKDGLEEIERVELGGCAVKVMEGVVQY